jgi:transposase
LSSGGHLLVRVTTAFKRLLALPGVHVTNVEFAATVVVVTVALRRRRLVCPLCDHSTRARYDSRPVDSRWQHVDLGLWKLEVRSRLRRLSCPDHGVITEGVAFARPGAGFTQDFEMLVAWLATRMDATAIAKLTRISWRTVGRIIERVVTDELDPTRLDGLFEIGVDEISWRKHHNYLTLVANHETGRVVWGREGKNAATLDGFFTELGTERSEQVSAISMDMGQAFAKSARQNAPNATICLDPFHVVALATRAVDDVRRPLWQQMRQLPDPTIAKQFKGARWALLKNPDNLTDKQGATLAAIRRNGGTMWRAYQLKEALRAIFAGDLNPADASHLLDRWCSWAQRCRLAPFVKLGRTIRNHRQGIIAAIEHRITNARVEGLNNRIRLIIRRAFGFHSAQAALALVMLSCGPITIEPPQLNPH